MIKPRSLEAGDRVAAVTLSWGGPAAFPHRFDAGKRQLEEIFGLELVAMPHTFAPAADPQARAADLMAALADPSIRGIISSIGGDDSIRTLPFVDPAVIHANPKAFLGYSDSTVTHLAFLNAGVVSFYGPSIMAGFAENGGLFDYTVESIRRTLFTAAPPGVIEPNTGEWTCEFLDWSDPANQNRKRARKPAGGWRWLQGEGARSGPLMGGCMEVLDFLRGTLAWPAHWDGAILFLEISEEMPAPAVLTRSLRSLAAVGILAKLNGILFGRTFDNFDAYDQAILRVVRDEEGLGDLPVVTRMDFGHTDPMMVLPYGVRAEIDCVNRRFAILG
jgi:muramoyltetrapeptide carboxypeptidase LdcA involved in peptidoglycan recycling